jgi:RNA polymerase sigma-70 factor, ECF subfamily
MAASDADIAAIAAAHPAIHVDRARFAEHLRALDAAPEVRADVYLAFAAAHGDRAAIDAIERDVMPAAAAALHVLGTTADLRDECLQRVRVTLLVGRDDHRPRLLDYRGRGSLRAWVRVVAVRESLMLNRNKKEIALGDAVLASVPDPADDPELRFMRGSVRDHLGDAVKAAIATLSSRERTLLRYSLIDALTLDEIGAIYRAHKSSVSRWLARARERLWQAARTALVEQLGEQSDEISSLVRRLRSGLDLSLERLLATS